MRQYIDFGNGHTTVVGMTQSGKTTAVQRSIESVKQGVLFFNTQQIEVSSKWIDADGSDSMDVLVSVLRKGEKVNFVPDRDLRWKQLAVIIKALYKATEASLMDIYIVVDEIHLADKEALKACIELATTGIRWGLKGIYISQRPALIDNTIMNQSMQFVVLKTTLEKRYMEGYGLPYEQIKAGLDSGGQYAYMVYDFHSLQGPYKV
jgi:DNA helicase HerA-like ATPase